MTRDYMSDGGRSAHKGKSEPMARVDAKAPMSATRPLALTRARCGVRAAATGRHAARAGLASLTTCRMGARVLQAERDLMQAKAAVAALRGPRVRRQGWQGAALPEAG